MVRNLAGLAAICIAASTTMNSANAEFIIDSFNEGIAITLPGGVTATRTESLGGGATFTENGTDVSATLGEFDFVDLEYTFSSALGATGDTLGGSPGLKLDFTSVGGSTLVRTSVNGSAFSSQGDVTGAGSFSFALGNLLDATTLAIRFINLEATASSFTLDRLTATPEPSTFAMVGLGMLGGGVVYRRRKKQAAMTA